MRAVLAIGMAACAFGGCSQASQEMQADLSGGLYALGDVEGRVSEPLISFDSKTRGLVNAECGVLLDVDAAVAMVRVEATDLVPECARLTAFSGRPLQVSTNEGGHPQIYYFREGTDGFSLINITPDH